VLESDTRRCRRPNLPPSKAPLSLPSSWSVAIFAGLLAVGLTAAAPADEPDRIEFNRDILPILSDACFHCHGPDKAQRKADLRLDIESEAKAVRDGKQIVHSGDPARSELHSRITSADPDEQMPPPDSGRNLTPSQIEKIRLWIEQGAEWQKHWAFIKPARPDPPLTDSPRWVRNPIDAFILARLKREGLSPSPAADKPTLLRRVSLDLTGLPPTPEEIEAFLSDASDSAYERVVDRLLASPRYGERMALPWLDAARYADTSGYQNDGPRSMWRWRDWVIDAFNHNQPFDKFTIEQIAGDMLPGATLDQKIATGFNRNHRGNSEGGVIPEEYAVEYVVDRVDTTATVWLGLTLGCARCHDHKYDPFTQKEFYQLFASFNNLPESGRSIKEGNSPPWIKAPTESQQRELSALEIRLRDAGKRFQKLQPELKSYQRGWEATFAPPPSLNWSVSDDLSAHFPLDGDASDSRGLAKASTYSGGINAFAPGRLGEAAWLDGKAFVDAADIANYGYFDKFSLAAWIRPYSIDSGMIVSRMDDIARSSGYSFGLQDGKLQVNLVKRWLDDSVRVETKQSVPRNRWTHVMMTYDGSRVAKGVKIYIDGRPEESKLNLDFINQSFAVDFPLRIGAGGGSESRFHGLIDEVRVFRRCLSPEEAELIATPDTLAEILSTPMARRTPRQKRKLTAYYLEHAAPLEIRRSRRELVALRRQKEAFVESIQTVMVMEELPERRTSHILLRGEYDKPGEAVSPGVPAELNPLPNGAKNDRLGFAQWLVHPDNPLTARVAVNRFWQIYFGRGLVETTEDFGTQGQRPTHPALLDWLAAEFIRLDWDVKAMQKTIVMSATYRQSSKTAPGLREADPENRLLAAGPRLRLSAQTIRDAALSASGLLVDTIGGPSVKPYQPTGLWKEIASGGPYNQDTGAPLYRRSLYTFWKRTVGPPSMINFDASTREACRVREHRTNTPLQALTLMNETTFVEAARAIAERAMTLPATSPEKRISQLFQLATSREPNPRELKILTQGFTRHLQRFRDHPADAKKLIGVGESTPDPKLDICELAAYTALGSLILNLDETITKQ
jgi:hypothetical protein